jgi:predicted TIM-barrel fold metal-dependent hydrolase
MMTHDRAIDEISALNLKDSVLEKYLHSNAAGLIDRMK